jgi:selenocysteine lyase/cysteine desulfurase
VLPLYGNTHTETSVSSATTTKYREEARQLIKEACNASSEDVLIFTGSGCTGAIDKLVKIIEI